MVLMLRRANPQSPKARGCAPLAALAGHLLWHGLKNEPRWPEDLVEVATCPTPHNHTGVS